MNPQFHLPTALFLVASAAIFTCGLSISLFDRSPHRVYIRLMFAGLVSLSFGLMIMAFR